ncbi:MAG: glycosyltransferase [Verrucomicrobiota bacterium]|nr:glycosyltransferase [Verrucomicrobiota bacterium]
MTDESNVSFIVPCCDDCSFLRECLGKLLSLEPMPQVVVSDASRDRDPVRALCNEFGVELVDFPDPSRGEQLDAGAALAKGKILVFHHADTDFTQKHYDSLNDLFQDDSLVLGGAFLKDIVALYPWMKFFVWIHKFYTVHIGTMYGDQSIFVLSSVFRELGGFRGMPLMEDVSFSSRLRDYGSVKVISPSLRSSNRKFLKEGYMKRKMKNMWLVFLFRIGVSPQRLKELYYPKKKT